MPICEVIEWGIHVGPLQLFPQLGGEIPWQAGPYSILNQVELCAKQDLTGEYYGVTARIEGPDKVALFNFYKSAKREDTPFLVLSAGQINRNRWTRGHLRWVNKERPLSFITEASQLPGSTL